MTDDDLEGLASPLTIRLFGPIDVRLNGDPLPRLHSRKGLWLLALLVLRHPSTVERDWLAGLLWPDSSEAQALASLRNTLADLRRTLGPEARHLCSPTTQTLSLDLTGAEVDVLDFDAAVARGDTPSLEEAVVLYRGPLLEGCVEEWVLPERERWEQAYLGALERLAAEAMGRGDYAAAEGWLRRAVAVDPTRESAQRALMEALAAGGNYAAATQVYRELRLHLHQELNAEPDAETKALYEQIRAEARRRAQAPPASVAGDQPSSPPASAPGALLAPGEDTLTFLFTDIEGSTKRWEAQPEAMRQALTRHDAILRAAIEANDGSVFKTVGDGVCAVFTTAPDAASAAAAAQRGLWGHEWGEVGPLRVRMALYTGIAEERGGDYVGPPLNRVARLLGAGSGGQILLSSATQELARDRLPEGVSLRDLGRHRLPDVPYPEQLFQLLHPDLPEAFPPLKTLGAAPNNLSRQLTSFLGREPEIAEVKRLLATTCLLTLTGTGGCGKTRLALKVAVDLLGEYVDGVWLVELASLVDGALVPQAVASMLGVREEPGRLVTETLTDHLRQKSLLLVLDNCEHLITDCAALANVLLSACASLRILATSREPLGIAGETTMRVPSLTCPDLPPGMGDLGRQSSPTPCTPDVLADVTRSDAVRLFADRASALLPTFAVTPLNALAVAQVCRRLDGIPLAIELAAARVKLLAVEQLADRLDDRFRLLTGGSRTALPRQQTLRATIDWSYDLLSEAERVLLRRLAVFAGGWTLEAAEAACAGGEVAGWWGGEGETDAGSLPSTTPPPYHLAAIAVLDLLSRLVDKSLVVVEQRGGAARYHLLETIRQYGAEKLEASGEAVGLCRQHRDWCLRLAEEAEPQLRGAEQMRWVERLEGEHDNVRAALRWSLSEGRKPPAAGSPDFSKGRLPAAGGFLPSDTEAGLRLAAAVAHFWEVCGYTTEGRGWLEEALQRSPTSPPAARAMALTGAGTMAFCQADYEAANAFHAEALALYRQVGDNRGTASALNNLGCQAHCMGDFGRATDLYEEGLALARIAGDKYLIWQLYNNRGAAELDQGRYERANGWLEEALSLAREMGNKRGIANSLGNMGWVAHSQRSAGRAQALFSESLALFRELGDKLLVADSLDGLVGALRAQEQWQRAAQLLGAVDALREAVRTPRPPKDMAEYERNVAATRAGLGEEAFAAAWAEGRAMTLEQTIAYALRE